MNKLLVHCADVAVRFLQCYIFPPAFKMVVFDKKKLEKRHSLPRKYKTVVLLKFDITNQVGVLCLKGMFIDHHCGFKEIGASVNKSTQDCSKKNAFQVPCYPYVTPCWLISTWERGGNKQ